MNVFHVEYVVKCKTADIPENEKDVWDMRKLDIVPRSNPIRGVMYSTNFLF